MSLVISCSHPLIATMLSSLRSKATAPPEFRRLVRSLARMIAQDATADLPTRDVEVETPLGKAPGKVIAHPVRIIPILRAGLGMAEGVLDLIPDAEVWHLGLRRDEETLLPEEYYRKLPDGRGPDATVLVVDPMLATGGSAVHACKLLKRAGSHRLKFLTLIAAPEGIARLSGAMPDLTIHVGVIDERLNERGYIVPGLGDAGDRLYATS